MCCAVVVCLWIIRMEHHSVSCCFPNGVLQSENYYYYAGLNTNCNLFIFYLWWLIFMLYIRLVIPKLEHVCTVRKSVTSTDSKKLERIQRKFVALCQYHVFPRNHVTYKDFLKFLKLHTLHDRRLYLDASFFISVYSGLKCHPSLLDTTGIRVLPRNFRNSSLFTATCKNSPSARCVSAANRVCTDIAI
jgi:hypothetical protein